MALTGNETLQVQGVTPTGAPAGPTLETTTGAIAALANQGQGFTFNTQTTNYILALSDAGNGVLMNAESDSNLTVAPDSSVNFINGAQVIAYSTGPGQITVVAGVGVTINTSAPTSKLRTTYSGISLQKTAANTWILAGDLALS